ASIEQHNSSRILALFKGERRSKLALRFEPFATELLFGPGRRRDPGCRMVRLCFRRSGYDGFTGSVLDSCSSTDYVRQARPSPASTALGPKFQAGVHSR